MDVVLFAAAEDLLQVEDERGQHLVVVNPVFDGEQQAGGAVTLACPLKVTVSRDFFIRFVSLISSSWSHLRCFRAV